MRHPRPAASGAHSVDVAALYATHAPEIRRLCLRLTRDPCAADDLAQETFVRFIARLPHLPRDVNVGAYLQVTARNLYFKHLRDHTHEVCDEFLEDAARQRTTTSSATPRGRRCSSSRSTRCADRRRG